MKRLGQLLTSAGCAVLLFVGYEVYGSNWFSDRDQARVHTILERTWRAGRDPLRALPDGALPKLPVGLGIANLYIPRLGRDYARTIVQGTGAADLEKGPGHYRFSALPGQVGNFAVAGHRVGRGEPFLNLDRLRAGDAVIVETRSSWYVYRVLGREIVDPGDGAVVDPVPGRPGRRPTERLMTMTTCTPKFSARQRMVVHARLQRTLPRTGAARPWAIKKLYRR